MADTPGRARVAVEMTDDPGFARRVRRLAATSAVALGMIWWLCIRTGPHPSASAMSLAGGWLLMPSLLWLSLRRPRLRYALVIPSALVTSGLIRLAASSGHVGPALRAGWLLMTAGVLTGGLLGVWFWFRLIPVPPRLTDPFSPGRWTLIAMHVGLIIAGMIVAGVAIVT